MATVIAERPHDFSFCENEIRYVFKTALPAAAGCAVEIEIHYMPMDQSADFNLITVSPVPDATGNIFFHIRDYLKSVLAPQMPDPGGDTIQPVGNQVKYFYIRFREISTANQNPDWISDKEQKKIVLLGGIEQMKFSRNNYFANYIVNYKPFLTWQPSNKQVFTDQDHYLTYLHATAQANFSVIVTTVFTDATTNTQTFVHVAANDVLFRIKTGVQQLHLDLIDPTKVLYYYEVRVESEGKVLAENYRFYLNYDHLYYYHDFNYHNSIGGVDGARLKGDFGLTVDTTSDDIERVKDNATLGSAFPVSQFFQSNIVKKDTNKGDLGWQRTPLQQEVMVELMVSKGIFENIEGRWIQVLNVKKSTDLRNNSDKKWSFPIEWTYAYADSVFTPKGILIGSGTPYVPPAGPPPPPPGTCVAVGIPVGISMPDGVVGQFYSFSFDLTGTAPFTISNVVKPSGMNDPTIFGNTISFTGTPDTAATGVAISCTINNCSTDSANFADTIDIGAAAVQSSDKAVVIINNSNTAIQVTADSIAYPSSPNSSGNFTVLTNGTIVISTGVGSYKLEFFTSYGPGQGAIYTTSQIAVNQPVLIPDLNNTNYIRISAS